MEREDLRALQEASEGLLYPSETDAPFDVFCWPAKGQGDAKEQVTAHVPKGRKLEEMPAESFFAELKDSDDAQRFAKLQEVLQSQLAGLKVFRAGSIRIDVYLLGKTKAGDWAGLHTLSVET